MAATSGMKKKKTAVKKTTKAGVINKDARSISERIGLTIPASLVKRYLTGKVKSSKMPAVTRRASMEACVLMAAIIEYIVKQTVGAAGGYIKKNESDVKRINSHNIRHAIKGGYRNMKELKSDKGTHPRLKDTNLSLKEEPMDEDLYELFRNVDFARFPKKKRSGKGTGEEKPKKKRASTTTKKSKSSEKAEKPQNVYDAIIGKLLRSSTSSPIPAASEEVKKAFDSLDKGEASQLLHATQHLLKSAAAPYDKSSGDLEPDESLEEGLKNLAQSFSSDEKDRKGAHIAYSVLKNFGDMNAFNDYGSNKAKNAVLSYYTQMFAKGLFGGIASHAKYNPPEYLKAVLNDNRVSAAAGDNKGVWNEIILGKK